MYETAMLYERQAISKEKARACRDAFENHVGQVVADQNLNGNTAVEALASGPNRNATGDDERLRTV